MNFHNASVTTGALQVGAGETLVAAEIDVVNQFIWTGGTVGGSGTLSIGNSTSSTPNLLMTGNSPFTLADGTKLVNNGQALVNSNATVNLVGGAQIDNAGAWGWQNSSNVAFVESIGPTTAAFTNEGTFTYSSPGALFFDSSGSGVAFDNNGSVLVTAGQLWLQGSGLVASTSISSGSFTAGRLGPGAGLRERYRSLTNTYRDHR